MESTRYARLGMVCTIDHLATTAGVTMLGRGGSAADAAIAANAVLAVTAPHACGLGGDLFALVHDGQGPPRTLNASGRAGSGADPDRLRAEGHERMPFKKDIRSVPVPGCADGWVALHARYGRLPLEEILAPAVRYAESGFPASPLLAPAASALPGVDGPVAPGAPLRRPGVARALAALGADGRDGFYLGEFGAGLLALGRDPEAGGTAAGEYSEADLARVNADWVEPIGVHAFGHDVWTVPPNSQGYLLPLALAIAEGLGLPAAPGDPLWAHLLAESARAAGHDRPDVLFEGAPVDGVLATANERRAGIDPARRSRLRALVAPGDTTYLCAVDAEGMGVSLIQSNAAGFGSMLFEPATGINLHNRGLGFCLVPGHPAEYGPGRRPPHTLAPALVTRPDGALRAVLGTMGGDSQPQILLQVLARLLVSGQTPGEAIGAPRWRLGPGDSGFDAWADPDGATLDIEEGAPWAEGLRGRGHDVRLLPFGGAFGHAHLIDVRPDGTLAGAADPRAIISSAAGL
ncbi:gamma-glutamyltranspeptidase [Sphaerisporangium siamense]|uniref:Gamma-glutamyltranspeptidase/glutathione hydrolase n=1 Tax=Sphaerisporangium siamense TaxID=795645 RepID=A0A7W7GCZ8_9ACTN|nr:gamma-glutamyltransferase [Sphaerisporangium siamense]MBB4702491.1 gamma-glutamyltranspeptidase/glutathione hydrolase [Sphaerisporangium siamense]GII88188.1 gamma-glutamyltranspeptidase [Sphaerisporangium siamense]